jgi:methylated-DNA-[protein]-cysteine S-methyltransferase
MEKRPKALSRILKDKNFTDFEKDVYKTICAIPRGEVRSYGWIAKRLGRSGASRAVGNALNKNPYPGPIPCHRVTKSDGSIGGYSRGISLKRKMLESEGRRSEGVDLF